MSDDKPQDDIIDIEPQVISETKSEDKRERSRWRRNAAMTAALVGLSAAGGGLVYRDLLASYLPNDEVHALSMRVDALEAGNKEAAKRVDAVVGLTDELKSQLGAAHAAADKSAKANADLLAQSQSNGESLAEFKQALEQTRAELNDVKAQLAAGGATGAAPAADPALAQRLESLEKSLTALQGAPSTKTDVAGLKLAIAALDGKIAEGAAYAAEIGAVANAVPAAEGLEVLKADAAEGAPNAQQLGAALALVVPQLPKSVAPAEGNGWLNGIASFFSNLITIKSIGGDDWGTAAAKAAALVAAGDLQQADSLLGSVEGAPPAALAAWRDSLQRRIKIEDALTKVNAAVAREIAAKG